MKSQLLVIDDDETNAHLLLEVLTKEGYSVAAVSLADQALKSAAARTPDLVLLDVHLRDMPSEDLLACLRRTTDPYLAAVGLSASPEQGWALQHGLLAFIPKPFDLDALTAVVRRSLEIVNRGRQLRASSERKNEPSQVGRPGQAASGLAARLSQEQSLEGAAQTLLDAAMAALRAPAGRVSLFTADGLLQPLARVSLLEDYAALMSSLPADAPLAMARAARSGQLVIEYRPEQASGPWPAAFLPVAIAYPGAAVVAAPIRSRRQIIGAVGVMIDRDGSLEEAGRVLESLGAAAGPNLQRLEASNRYR